MEQILSERFEETFAANDFSYFLEILHKMAVKEFDTCSTWLDISYALSKSVQTLHK